MAYVYYHTVETFINWQTAANVTQQLSIQDQSTTIIENLANYPNLVASYLENNNTPITSTGGALSGVYNTAKNNTTIEPGFEVLYQFRFYMHDTTNNKLYWLGDVANNGKAKYKSTSGDGTGLTAGTTYNLNIIQGFAVNVANTGNMYSYGSNYYSYGGHINGNVSRIGSTNNNGDVYKVYVKPKATGWSMFNAVTVNVNIQNTGSGTFIDPNPNIVHSTLLGITPGYSVSTKRTTPPIPSNITNAVFVSAPPAVVNGGWNQNGYIWYDYCGMWGSSKAGTSQFVGVQITANATGSIANGSYTYTLYSVNVNGSNFTKLETRTEKGNPSAPGPGLAAIFTQARLVVLANCVSPGVATPNVTPGSGSGSGGTITVAPADENRYNPPPHIGARDISYGQRMIENKQVVVASTDPTRNTVDGLATYYEAMAQPTVEPMSLGYKGESRRTANLGRLIQDRLSADTVNGPGKALWGYRFMYNPQNISYSTASDTSIDWSLGRKDPSVLLSGNQNVTIQLYINRIPDMAYLREYVSAAHKGSMSMEQAYGRKLQDYEVNGILNRGTEYDIEFLYRVVNGDPKSKSLLFGDSYTDSTADFGYTTSIPVWMHLNDNLRYYGSVANITVNHAMFNLDMVPILSTVTLGFTRYPALWNNNSASLGSSQKGVSSQVAGAAQTATQTASNTTGTTAPKK